VLVDHRIPNPATRGKVVYPMSGNLMFFEKIIKDDCLFLYGARSLMYLYSVNCSNIRLVFRVDISYFESKLDAEP
jgi:hypothetical protein